MKEQTVFCRLDTLRGITKEVIALLGEEEARKISLWKCLRFYEADWFSKIYFLEEVE